MVDHPDPDDLGELDDLEEVPENLEVLIYLLLGDEDGGSEHHAPLLLAFVLTMSLF